MSANDRRSNDLGRSVIDQLLFNLDQDTIIHTMRVVAWCMTIADSLRLEKGRVAILRLAALSHDLGKFGLQSIYGQPRKLNPGEKLILDSHDRLAEELLVGVDLIEVGLLAGVHNHPAEYRGHMYLELVILVVADIFDATYFPRGYRKYSLSKTSIYREVMSRLSLVVDKVIPAVDPIILVDELIYFLEDIGGINNKLLLAEH